MIEAIKNVVEGDTRGLEKKKMMRFNFW